MNWRKPAETIGVGSLALAIGILAFVHEGVPAAEIELNDGGVWVSNGAKKFVGHLNYESRTLDGALRTTTSSFDLSQYGNNVMVTSPESIHELDTASVALTSETSVAEVSFAQGDETVLFAHREEGKVWASTLEGISGFNPQADPLVEELDKPLIAVGPHGDAFVATADGVVRTITGLGEDAVIEEVGSLGTELSEAAQLTVVDKTLVVFDQGAVRTVDRVIELPEVAEAVLQQPSLAGNEVLLATADSLIRVPLTGGEASSVDVPNGQAARPVLLDGCAYGLWAKSGYYLRDCGDAELNEAAQFPELAKAKDPVFRTNRKVLVINDLATGAVYLPLESMERVDNWDLISKNLEEQEEEKESDESTETEFSQLQEFSEEQNPPVAEDDKLGARPGVSTTLPILVNDLDLDGDVLTAIIKKQPAGIPVSLAKDGRAVSVDVPADATGRFTFTYQAYDGVDLSNEATVAVTLSPEGSNKAPERLRSNTIQLSERATAEYSVLPDWVDPDGDPLFLENAVGEDGLSVTWRPDGYISVRDLGTGGPGRRSITVVVSDGSESTAKELVVQIMPGSSNTPPVANNDHFVANVGEMITLRPLSNDTDADGDALRLVEFGATEPQVELVPDYNDNSAQFTADEPGSHIVVYSISDGPNKSKGKIRVDVIDPEEADEQPVAENDLALMSPTGTVVVEPLNNDFDPAGGVLVIQGTSMGSAEGINVEVVRHSLLRVTAPAGIESPQSFEYTVSNGKASATASVLVVPLAAQSEIQAPVAVPEKTVVRAGDIVTVDVLANDYSPADLPIHLLPELDVRSDEELGEFFVSGDKVRFRAGDEAGTAEVIYTVADSQKNVASSTVTISIRGFDETNQKPAPRAVTGRTFSGMTTMISIPMDGVDPDGDSVELVGVGSIAPTRGSVEVQGNFLVYTASKVDPGTDVFTYKVRDRFDANAEGFVRVGIAPAPTQNQPPVAVPDEIAARPGTRLEIPVIKNDIDPDGDKISIIGDSIKPVDDRWNPEAKLEKQSISVLTPAEEGTYQLYYSIRDGRAAPVVGVVTITVDENVPPVAPVAHDDYVTASSVAELDAVEVAVLDNDEDPDGEKKELVVEVEEPATVNGAVVTVPLTEDRQIVLYTVRDLDDLTARAAIVVPGKNQIPPMLNPEKVPAVVEGGKTLTVDFSEYVLTRPGHSAKLTTVDSVVAGPGGNKEDPDLGLKWPDDTTITFTPDVRFVGATSLSFEVHDGDSVDDPRGLRETLSLPIEVTSSGLFPPELRPGEVRVERGEAPIDVSLAGMVDDPDDGDNEKMAYSIISASDGVDASISGQTLSVSVPADAPLGTGGSIVVSVHDGTTDPLEMTLPVTVLSSTRPLMSVTDINEPEGRVGVPKTFNLADVITNPFADRGGEIELVGQPEVSGPAEVSAEGLTVTVTPQTSGSTGDSAEDVVVTYTVADATKDSSRYRTGTIRVVVKDVPMPPTNVIATARESKTANVEWSHSGWRGGQPDGFTVSWDGGSKDCGLQTSCDIDTLANNNTYTFTVSARVKEADIADSAASVPSNDIFVDALPDTPVAPVAKFGDQEIDLSWAATTVPDGGSPVTSYTVEIMPADTAGRTQQVVSGTSMTWNKLANGTAYTFTLTAHNKLTEVDTRVTAPTGPASAPETPAGAPSNQGAPEVVKDKAAAGVAPRATVSWSAPGNPNGDTSFTYQMRQRGMSDLLYEGSSTSSAVTMSVGTEDKTFEVRSTNKSGKWSEWSPASNAVRAFQPPGAPGNFRLTPTGDGTKARFNFGAAAGNGAKSSEIVYRWNAGGDNGTVTDGQTINSSAFALGHDVQVQLRAISTVKGETSEGPTTSATVNTYAPPDRPSVSAGRASNGRVDVSWSMPERSNGRPVTVKVSMSGASGSPDGSTSRSGNATVGSGPNQNITITVKVTNSEGQTSERSASASTRGNGRAYERHASNAVGCPTGVTPGRNGCRPFQLELRDWYPNSTVTCTVGGTNGTTRDQTYHVDGNGWARGNQSDVAVAIDWSGYTDGRDVTHEVNCRY
ncbi:Ig-like domain-containing protein [Tessaracoccus caeni]|uniref:Ig-like domain-containing protein n=1 Tax=Tessaracoccus caeni TaxID=3031239 RepID=UPI0023DC8902|nr:Ig-like domain-containing protein [Tessaracoccus caeni]MDF1487691.1 Ig-like domain-containing protein [Tessaracoccus caeni]